MWTVRTVRSVTHVTNVRWGCEMVHVGGSSFTCTHYWRPWQDEKKLNCIVGLISEIKVQSIIMQLLSSGLKPLENPRGVEYSTSLTVLFALCSTQPYHYTLCQRGFPLRGGKWIKTHYLRVGLLPAWWVLQIPTSEIFKNHCLINLGHWILK